MSDDPLAIAVCMVCDRGEAADCQAVVHWTTDQVDVVYYSFACEETFSRRLDWAMHRYGAPKNVAIRDKAGNAGGLEVIS